MIGDDLRAKFDGLLSKTRKVLPFTRREPEPPPEPDPAVLRAEALHQWARESEGTLVLKWLEQEISAANSQAHAAAGTPQSAYWLGAEAGLRVVRDEMKKWRGQPAGIPPARPSKE